MAPFMSGLRTPICTTSNANRDPGSDAVTVHRVTITPAAQSVEAGASLQLTAAITDRLGRPVASKVATWASSNPARWCARATFWARAASSASWAATRANSSA